MKTLSLIILTAGLGAGCGKQEQENAEAEKPKPNPSSVVVPTPDRSADILERAIRKQLKKPKGELTQADLEKVTELNLGETQITDAGGGGTAEGTAQVFDWPLSDRPLPH